MPKEIRIISCGLLMLASITLLHIWLNIGFDRLGVFGSGGGESSFRVGFLPVT